MTFESTAGPAPAAAPPLLAGRYELGERISEGVYFYTHKAREVETGRLVAVKILKLEYAADAALTEQILAEARAAMQLQHPGIARVYEAWPEQGTVAIAVEWVRGINLKDRIRRVAPFPVGVAVDILSACADALAYAHNAGFVHGDVRPENIIVTPDGRVKLTDFGLGTTLATSSRTQLAVLPRAAPYMAPEVAQGRSANAGTDLYSLGCILYEMLAGEPPYTADTPLAITARHLRDPAPSLRRANPAVPPALDGLTRRLMQKDPASRYRDASDLVRDLRSIREGQGAERPVVWTPDRGAEEVGLSPAARVPRHARAVREAEAGGPSLALLGWLGLLIVVMVLGSFLGVSALLGRQGRMDVAVPANLIGQTEDAAREELRRSELVPEVVPSYSDTVESGRVMDVYPPAGTLIKSGKAVRLTVSRGAQPIRVPDVANMPLEEAQKKIRGLGLVTGNITAEYDEIVPKGRVVHQTPAANAEAPRGSAVDFVVSRGKEELPEPVPVPLPDPTEGGGDPTDPNDSRRERSVELPPGPERRHIVSIGIPASRRGPQRVRVVVVYENGAEETQYDQIHEPGETIEPEITTRGTPLRSQIRVYLNERLESSLYK